VSSTALINGYPVVRRTNGVVEPISFLIANTVLFSVFATCIGFPLPIETTRKVGHSENMVEHPVYVPAMPEQVGSW
jgi:hypothetical protein